MSNNKPHPPIPESIVDGLEHLSTNELLMFEKQVKSTPESNVMMTSAKTEMLEEIHEEKKRRQIVNEDPKNVSELRDKLNEME